jgi:hypothetical protein
MSYEIRCNVIRLGAPKPGDYVKILPDGTEEKATFTEVLKYYGIPINGLSEEQLIERWESMG